jgi:hypothetical protein
MLGFTHGRARTLVRLGVTERVAWRRKRLAEAIKDGPLDCFLAGLLSPLFHGIKDSLSPLLPDAKVSGVLVSTSSRSLSVESLPRLRIESQERFFQVHFPVKPQVCEKPL